MLATGYDWFDGKIRGCADVGIERLEIVGRSATIAYVDQMIDGKLLAESILPSLYEAMRRGEDFRSKYPVEALPHGNADERKSVFAKLFSGYLLIFREGELFGYSLASIPGRQPEESNSEISVKGPRDGFVEEMAVNLALIRKRLRTPDMKIERYTIGSLTQSEMALVYIEGIARPEWVEEARRRLSNIHTEAVNGAAQVEEMLSDRSTALFPLIDYSTRPDSAVDALLLGRIVFLLDGSPMIFIGPTNLLSLMRTPEDNYMPFYFVTLEKMVRILSLGIAIFLPGFWVALSSYNVDQIPFPLLSTIVISRVGLPVSATIEMLMMLALFEVFREAGVRLPRAVGQTVAVVGGIVVGDAAIRAGLASPTMLVVSSLTAVASFTLVNQSLSGAVTVVRLFILMICMLFGMFGFFIGALVVLMYLASLRSLGAPYLLPLAPVRWNMLAYVLLRYPSAKTRGPYMPLSPKRSGK